jgi:hypothetical protein
VIAQCTPAFASGCYHGVVEAMVGIQRSIEMKELQRMCLAAGGAEQPGPTHECFHGLGHGLLGAVRLNSREALRYCDQLTRSTFAASCRSGVFTEAINAALPGTHATGNHGGHADPDIGEDPAAETLTLDPADPYAPCSAFEGDYAAACWLFQGFVILRATAFDVLAAFRVCDSAPGGRAGECYESLGHQLTGLLQRGDQWIIEQCTSGRPSLAPRCAGGAALALSGADWSGRRTEQFCSAVPDVWKSECYRAGAALLNEVASPADLEWFCARRRDASGEPCTTPPPALRHPRS